MYKRKLMMENQDDNLIKLNNELVDYMFQERVHQVGQFMNEVQLKSRIRLELNKDFEELKSKIISGKETLESTLKNEIIPNSTQYNEKLLEEWNDFIDKSAKTEWDENAGLASQFNLSELLLQSLYEAAVFVYNKGMYEKAENCFLLLLRIDRTNGNYYRLYGHSAFYNEHYDLATVAYAGALLIKPEDLWSWYYLALVELRKDNKETAKEIINHLLQQLEKSGESEGIRVRCEELMSLIS